MIRLTSVQYRHSATMQVMMRSSLMRSSSSAASVKAVLRSAANFQSIHTYRTQQQLSCMQTIGRSPSAALATHSSSLTPSSSFPSHRHFSTTSPASSTTDPAAASTITTPEQTKPAAADKPSATVRLTKWFEKNRLKWYNFGVAGAVSFGVYLINDFGFDLINFYLEQREADAAHLAYLTGIAATGVSYLLYRGARRFYALNASRMYREVLRAVFNNAEVQEKLGGDVRKKTLQRMQRYGRNKLFENSGKANAVAAATISSSSSHIPSVVPPNLRLVSFIPASLSVRKSKEAWMKYVQPRRLQFIIHVEGSNGHGLVQAEVEQTLRGDFDDTNIIVVDLLDKSEQIQVRKHYDTSKRRQDLTEGDEEQTGVIKGRPLLSQKVVKY